MASLFGRGFDSLQVHDDYLKPLNISGFFCFFKLLFFPHFISQFHQKSYIKICSSIWIELFYINVSSK